MAGPIDVTDNTWEDEVLNSDLPILVDFWAEWCGPCKMIAPAVHDLAEEYTGKLNVAKVDIDNSPEIATKYDFLLSLSNLFLKFEYINDNSSKSQNVLLRIKIIYNHSS